MSKCSTKLPQSATPTAVECFTCNCFSTSSIRLTLCFGDWGRSVTILWLQRLTVGLIDCHVIRKTRAVGSTPDEGHCTVLRAQPLLRCVNIWAVYLSPSRLLIAYSFAYACLLMAYSFAYLCLRIAYWFLPSRWLISLVVYVYKKLWDGLMSLKLNLINTTKQTFTLPVHNLNGPPLLLYPRL